MITRALQLATWALLGAAATYGLVAALDEFGLALALSLQVVGLAVFAIRTEARPERLGLVAGPGLLFMVAGEADDAPGLVLIGMAVLAAAAAIYVSRVRRQPTVV